MTVSDSLDITDRIDRAKELLSTARHAAMATVNEDGSPHNSPLLFLHSLQNERVYWCSHPESLHSHNILRTGQAFVVVFDAMVRGGGLYIRVDGGHIAEAKELDEALLVHNTYREKQGWEPLDAEYYQGDSPQRMWLGDISGLWVNKAERGPDDRIIRDYRIEIPIKDLL